MVRVSVSTKIAVGGLALVWASALLEGCGQPRSAEVAGWPGPTPVAIAVTPALNLSGSTDFDPVVAGDVLASELSDVSGVHVIGINRVLAAMAELGLTELRGPEDAIEVGKRLGVDGVLVFAVTEYDPYNPPVVGLAAQLYGVPVRDRSGSFDAVQASRSAVLSPQAVGSESPLLAEYQRVFDASQDAVAAEVKDFARLRRADQSPYAWRKYLASQQHYLRFCCNSMAHRLMDRARFRAEPLNDGLSGDREWMP